MGLGNKAIDPMIFEPDADDLQDDPIEVMEAERPAAKRLKPSEIALLIAEDCGLAKELAESVCLSCKNRVMVQAANNSATIYCQALNRDLEISITRCTSYTRG